MRRATLILLCWLAWVTDVVAEETVFTQNLPAFELQAGALMDSAREALTQGDAQAAIQIFGQLLKLPPNAYSQDAQELIGLARERSGDIVKARMEYQLYLQLYPDSDGAQRVRQRLANLEEFSPAPTLKSPTPAKPQQAWSLYGGWSQYYYGGRLHSESQGISSDSTDQSALTSSLDLTGRYRSERYDNRLVLRESYTRNFLSGQSDKQRLNAAYYEVKNRQQAHWIRLGRQAGNSSGILGRFDGVMGVYALSPSLRLGAATGQPAEYKIDSRRQFYGLNLELGPYAQHWSGNLYTIEQRVDRINDRRAVGGELRYVHERASSYTLLDYDSGFKRFNIAMWQANWQSQSGAAVNALVDLRKTPSLQTSNAFAGEATTSMNTLLTSVNEAELRRRAQALTATAYFYLLGFSYPLSPRWQLGADARISYITGTQGSGTQPATPSTGSIYTYTAQAVRQAWLSARDILIANTSLTLAPSYQGQSWSLNHVAVLRDVWTLDSSLRYYLQRDDSGSRLKRWTPTLRGGYRWQERLTLESELGLEKTQNQNAGETDSSDRWFFFLGYRWDI